MDERTITVKLTEDQYQCVQAQLENRNYLSGEAVDENEYLANALASYASLKETSQYYMETSETLCKRNQSLERACDIHYTNLLSVKSVWNWIQWKFFGKTLQGKYNNV